jgi:hypothetical protein
MLILTDLAAIGGYRGRGSGRGGFNSGLGSNKVRA